MLGSLRCRRARTGLQLPLSEYTSKKTSQDFAQTGGLRRAFQRIQRVGVRTRGEEALRLPRVQADESAVQRVIQAVPLDGAIRDHDGPD